MSMKKHLAVVITLVMVLCCFAACGGNNETNTTENTSTASETYKATTFKAGTWTGDAVEYTFYEDGKGGESVSTEDGMGIAFEYELNEDGSCVFHMGSVDDNTRATVEFADENTATITWENGSSVVLNFLK